MWSDSPTLRFLDSMNYGVVAILGSGKTFKSGTMYTILNEVPSLKKRNKAFLKFSGLEYFPPGYGHNVTDYWDVEPGSILIIEDANRLFPSRQSSKAPDLQEFIGIISHKDILIFLTTQNTANVDMAFFRDQDNLLIHKYMNPLSIAYEREEITSYCQDANRMICEKSYEKKVDWHYLSYVPMFSECLILDHPVGFYNWNISHSLRDYRPDKKGVCT